MKPFGSVEFNIEELPGELKICFVCHAGWIEAFLAPAAVPVFAVFGWFWQKPALIVGAGGLTVLLIARWAWNHQSVLRVLPDRLITSVYLWNSTETELSDIKNMLWRRGDPWWHELGEPAGLYVSCAGRWKCVLPLASREHASAAMEAISRKFPGYRVGAPTPWSI